MSCFVLYTFALLKFLFQLVWVCSACFMCFSRTFYFKVLRASCQRHRRITCIVNETLHLHVLLQMDFLCQRICGMDKYKNIQTLLMGFIWCKQIDAKLQWCRHHQLYSHIDKAFDMLLSSPTFGMVFQTQSIRIFVSG